MRTWICVTVFVVLLFLVPVHPADGQVWWFHFTGGGTRVQKAEEM